MANRTVATNTVIVRFDVLESGMIRKRARGIVDTDYFKLKIRQTALPDNQPMFYKIT